MTQTFPITFAPAEKRAVCTSDEILIEVARRTGVRIASACGGRGRCRSCAVRIEGAVPEPTAMDLKDFTAEEIAAGWRRACQVRPVGACTVHVPAKTAASAVAIGQEAGAAVIPIESPVLHRNGSDGVFHRGHHAVGPIPGARALGLAVDLGTTNLAAAVIDLQSGRVLATGAKENPQAVFGADVISRLMQAMRGDATARELQAAAIGAISELISDLTEGHPELIAELAVVGNSVMQHLLLRLPVESLARAPYRPHTFDAVDVPASELGLQLAPGAWLHFGPNVAGFVGSDHVAALLETLADPPPGRWALLDIGTNTEISLFHDGELTSVSCASGPAFEGGLLSCGMRAGPGAIEKVRIEGSSLRLDTIDNAQAVGICGSGVLSLLSELRRSGAVNASGRLSSAHPRVRTRGHTLEFVLADETETGALPVVFTQADVRAVQLAKAAIRAGLDLLLASRGLREEELDRIIVAGAFGKYIDIDEAVNIGLLPPPRDRIVQVGNAAGAGVRRILACAGARARSHELARRAHYVELASRPDFQKTFISRISL